MGCFSHRKRTPETNFEPNIKHFEIIFVDQAFPNRKLISRTQYRNQSLVSVPDPETQLWLHTIPGSIEKSACYLNARNAKSLFKVGFRFFTVILPDVFSFFMQSKVEGAENIYCTRAIITRGLYTFYPIFEGQKRFLRTFFCKILTLCMVSIQKLTKSPSQI